MKERNAPEETYRLFLLLLPLLALWLAGCAGSLKQPDPAKQFYALAAERAASPAAAPASPAALKIKRINIAPAYASRELIYKTAENTFFPDYYNLLLVPPKDNLTQVLRAWMEASNVFAHVVANESDIAPDYVLESTFSQLYADFSAAKGATAIMEVQFFLLRDADGRFDVAMSKNYRQEIPLADRLPETLVKGYNQSLAAILAQFENDARAALAAPKPAKKQ